MLMNAYAFIFTDPIFSNFLISTGFTIVNMISLYDALVSGGLFCYVAWRVAFLITSVPFLLSFHYEVFGHTTLLENGTTGRKQSGAKLPMISRRQPCTQHDNL